MPILEFGDGVTLLSKVDILKKEYPTNDKWSKGENGHV